jgi:hypothetical protein
MMLFSFYSSLFFFFFVLKDFFIALKGRYLRSCFGCALDHLVRIPQPIRSATNILKTEDSLRIPKVRPEAGVLQNTVHVDFSKSTPLTVARWVCLSVSVLSVLSICLSVCLSTCPFRKC